MFHIVTIASDKKNEGYYRFLKPSAENNDINLKVIDYEDQSLYKFRNKDYSLKKYLHKIDNEDFILFTDGYDSFFMCDVEEIKRKYADIKMPLLFSGETHCWPDPRLSIRYTKMESARYKYLNSGGFIGKVGILKELLEEDSIVCDKSWFRWSNQYLWTMKYFTHPNKIGIDVNCNIFCTFANADIENKNFNNKKVFYQEMKTWFKLNFEIKEGRIYNKITNTWPCVAHFHGYSRELMDDDILNMISCQKNY